MSHQHTRANLILLLEAYRSHKSNKEVVPGWNTELLLKKSFQNQIVCFHLLLKIFSHKGRHSSHLLGDEGPEPFFRRFI